MTGSSGGDVWNVWQWAAASNERAVANARAASVECSRARLERAEVEHYLALVTSPAAGLPDRVSGEPYATAGSRHHA